MSTNRYDVVVFGGGPAGLTASLYLLRGGKSVCLIEKTAVGGQTNLTGIVENFPCVRGKTGFELSNELFMQCKEAGLVAKYGDAKIEDVKLSPKKIIISNEELEAENIVIATGAKPRRLGLSGEEGFVGRGISFCAHCDGNFFKNRTVAVVGGGDTALTDALFLSNICLKVYLIHRRNEFRGTKKYVDELKTKQNVELVLSATPKKLVGAEVLAGLVVNTEKGERTLEIAGLFEAVGITPEANDFAVEKNEAGFIAVDRNKKTNVLGVYAVGDVTDTPLKQIVTACADGAIAANAIINKL